MSKIATDVGGPERRTARGSQNVPSLFEESTIRRGSAPTVPTAYTFGPEAATSAAMKPSFPPVPTVAPVLPDAPGQPEGGGGSTLTWAVADAEMPNRSVTVSVNAYTPTPSVIPAGPVTGSSPAPDQTNVGARPEGLVAPPETVTNATPSSFAVTS